MRRKKACEYTTFNVLNQYIIPIMRGRPHKFSRIGYNPLYMILEYAKYDEVCEVLVNMSQRPPLWRSFIACEDNVIISCDTPSGVQIRLNRDAINCYKIMKERHIFENYYDSGPKIKDANCDTFAYYNMPKCLQLAWDNGAHCSVQSQIHAFEENNIDCIEILESIGDEEIDNRAIEYTRYTVTIVPDEIVYYREKRAKLRAIWLAAKAIVNSQP